MVNSSLHLDVVAGLQEDLLKYVAVSFIFKLVRDFYLAAIETEKLTER